MNNQTSTKNSPASPLSLDRSTTSPLQRFVWIAAGMMLAIIASLTMSQAWSADAAPGDDDATYVPIPSCRVFDFRPDQPPAGGKKTPLGAGETYVQQITGAVGDCTIPNTAVGVAMNVTVTNGTAPSNLRVFPADVVEVPTVSNLNWVPGMAPLPNKVDVKLSPDGKVKLYNQNGTVDVVGDIVGYYTSETLQELNQNVELLLDSRSFVKTDHVVNIAGDNLTTNPMKLASVEITAPVDGQVTLTSQTQVNRTLPGFVGCTIEDTLAVSDTHLQVFQANGPSFGSINNVRTFDIAAGQTVEYVLSCIEDTDTGIAQSRTLTGVFTPATS
ncbi:MAG: hypothetical protein AAGA42_09290 [Actinomycetota bacterium]